MNKKLGSTLIAMTVIIFMLFLTLGMFTKNFGGTAKAEVASAQTKIVNGELMDVNTDDNSIDAENTGKYWFSVKNTDDNGKRTEVKMQYKIVVETEQGDEANPISVAYQLYDATKESGKDPVIIDETKPISQNTEDGNEVFTSSDMVLNIDKDEVRYYVLKFTPENDGQFKFKVKVVSEQVD